MSSVRPIPFALPDVGEDEIAAVAKAIRSGWLSSGPMVKRFEAEFARRIGGGVEAVAVNSATAGLHLALEACGIGPGDEVLVPAWTFTATAEVVRYMGATPILVDVAADSLLVDLEDAARMVTARTRAIIPVHFAGLMVDPSSLEDFARAHGLRVIEDAAHAFPASRDGVAVGTSSSAAAVFSFYATKTMTTGEGGMVVTRDAALAERVRVMRLHGISRDAFDRYRSEVPAWHYEVVAPGYKYNLTDPAAAMGLVQLERVEQMRARRQAIAERYLDALAPLPGLELPWRGPTGALHSWHLFVARVEAGVRNRLISDLSSAGVGTSVHFIPLQLHPVWAAERGSDAPPLPVSSQEFYRVLSLPLYSAMSDEDVEHVIASLERCLR